jgi:glycosyltransferase involved in cell wall biosynthesis
MAIQETRSKPACLIIAEHPPESYSPAGERLRHMALAGRSFFRKTIVLTSGKDEKQDRQNVGTKVFLYKTGVARSIPYPISALFDPIKLLAFFIHGLVLSAQYKPSCIIASMPPIEAGASAWLLAGFLHRKLIIDLRDDWESSLEVQLTRYIPLRLLKLSFKVANSIYSSSKAILVATPTIADILRRRNVHTPIISVPNGANTAIFFPREAKSRREIRLRHALPTDKIVVIYCGSGGNPYYRLDKVLLGVKSLANGVRNSFFFVFYLYNEIEPYRKMKDQLKISDNLVELRGPKPRAILAEIMASCDVGLVPFDDKPYLQCARSAKIYEYLSAGLYVFSHGPKGGELDCLFSHNPQLGKFGLLHSKNSFNAFFHDIRKRARIFDSDSRFARYKFIQENHDRKAIMEKTMRTIRSLFVSTAR